MNVPTCKTLSLAVLAAAFALGVSGCYLASTHAGVPYSSYDGHVPYPGAHIGIQKDSPYLYRYEHDWKRNRAWRDRDNPLLYYPTTPPAHGVKSKPGDGASRKEGASGHK